MSKLPEDLDLEGIQDWLQKNTGISSDNKQIAFLVISMVSNFIQSITVVEMEGMKLIGDLVMGREE
jgi:hypothetical protein